ncbi:MAG: HEAT repeat domain-containing protein [bacterium]
MNKKRTTLMSIGTILFISIIVNGCTLSSRATKPDKPETAKINLTANPEKVQATKPETDVPHFPSLNEEGENNPHPHPASPLKGEECKEGSLLKGEENSEGSPLKESSGGSPLDTEGSHTRLGTSEPGSIEGDIQTWIQQLSSGNKAARDQARDSLIQAGSAAIPALARILETTTDFTPCWEAVNIMGYIADAKAAPYLVEQSLKATNSHVRWRSIWALASMPEEDILPPLLKALEDPDERIKWNAAVALSNFDRKEAVPILKEGLKNSSSWTQWEAINALGRVYDQETVPALLALLDCSTCTPQSNQQEAILSLGQMNDLRAIPALVKALEDSRSGIRLRAALALGNINDAAAIPALEKCLKKEQDEMVISSVKEAIERLKANQPANQSGQEEISLQKTEEPE